MWCVYIYTSALGRLLEVLTAPMVAPSTPVNHSLLPIWGPVAAALFFVAASVGVVFVVELI